MREVCLVLAGLLAASAPAYSNLVASQPLLALERGADLIVVASIGGISTAGGRATVALDVSRVLQGSSSLSGSRISVTWTSTSDAVADVAGVGIWFLKASGSGWTLLPVMQGNIPLSLAYFPTKADPLAGAYAYGPTASISDKVASEISWATECLNGAYNMPLYLLHYGPLDQLGSPYVTLLYQRLANSSVAAQRILGIAGLVRTGDVGALTSAIQIESTATAHLIEYGMMLSSIREIFRATSSDAVAVLGQAATDSANASEPLREAAGHALSAVHTLASLPYLVTLLSDNDPLLRAEAVGGIGSFANGLAVQTLAGVPGLLYLQFPASAPYMTASTRQNFALGRQAIARNESAYISFWEQWWLQNRTALGF